MCVWKLTGRYEWQQERKLVEEHTMPLGRRIGRKHDLADEHDDKSKHV